MTSSCGLKLSESIHSTSGCSTGMISSRPSSLYSRLPSATRRPAAFCMLVLMNASNPLPMLAPTTRPMATGRLITSAPASVAVSSTAARLE
ncbi:hypothetical protein D3C81_1304670 [compost metagenome]